MSKFGFAVVSVLCAALADVTWAGNATYTVHISRGDTEATSGLGRFDERDDGGMTAGRSGRVVGGSRGENETAKTRIDESPTFPKPNAGSEESAARKKSGNRTIVTRGVNEEESRSFDRGERFLPRASKRFSKRGQGAVFHEVYYDGGANAANSSNSPLARSDDAAAAAAFRYVPAERDFSARAMDDYSGERYYYGDYSPAGKEAIPGAGWRMSDPVAPETRGLKVQEPTTAPPPQFRRPLFERNSCKQYLEFLKYAFEQIDSPARKSGFDARDDYYYYDADYDYHQWDRRMPSTNHVTKVAPQIAPNMELLHALAYEGENQRADAEGNATKSSSPVVNWTEAVRRTPAPSPQTANATNPTAHLTTTTTTTTRTTTPWSSTEAAATAETTFQAQAVTDLVRADGGVPVPVRGQNATREYHVGMALGSTTRGPQDPEDVAGNGCHKMFPCPDNVNVTYPVNGYCNSFIVCESGKSHPEFCLDGLHFNIITKRCDLPHNSFCTYSCPRANGYFGVPGDCGGFFRCLNWYPEYRLCPPRMHWDYKAKICTFEELSACPLKCELPYQVKPYNGVCNAYVICTRGVPQYHKCPDGSHFDRVTLKCVDKSKSSCVIDEDYIRRNRGIENGRKKLCADVQLSDGKSRWCQEPSSADD